MSAPLFVWYDLMTPDASAAQRFYPAVTGWGTQAYDEFPYTMWTAGRGPIGGMVEYTAEQAAKDGIRPHWISYVQVDDVDASAAKAESLGGRVLFPPTDIPGTGRFATLADPQGAVFAIYKSSTDTGTWREPADGEMSWHELSTSDYRKGFDFYAALFGWQLVEDSDMGEMGIYRLFGLDGMPLGGMFEPPPGSPAPYWRPYVRVPDIDGATAKITAAGGAVQYGPIEVPGGDRVTLASDAQGAMFGLHSPARR